MILTDMISSLRIELQDTEQALYQDDELLRAIEKSVSLMSRFIPKRSIIETTIVREITGETLAIASNSGTLAYKPIRVGSLAITGKTLDTDYRVDYLTGVITEIGSKLPDGNYTASYELDPSMLDLSPILTDFIKLERVEYPAGINPPTLVTADTFGSFLVFRGGTVLTGNNHLRIVYLGRWTPPDVDDEGDYPSHLNDGVIIGSAGQALIFKAEYYMQQVATTVANAVTALSGISELVLGALPTPPDAPDIVDLTPPDVYAVSKPSSPELPTPPTAPSVPVLNFDPISSVAYIALWDAIDKARTHLEFGEQTINAAARGIDPSSTRGQYAGVEMQAANTHLNEAISRIRELETQVAHYASQVTAFGSEVNRYANQVSGMVGKYEREIAAENLGINNVAALVGRYNAEIAEQNLVLSKFSEQVRSYAAQMTGYQAEVAAYNANVSAILGEVTQLGAQAANYLNIAGRFLASGQAKINEFLVSLGQKPEFAVQKASSEQRS